MVTKHFNFQRKLCSNFLIQIQFLTTKTSRATHKNLVFKNTRFLKKCIPKEFVFGYDINNAGGFNILLLIFHILVEIRIEPFFNDKFYFQRC